MIHVLWAGPTRFRKHFQVYHPPFATSNFLDTSLLVERFERLARKHPVCSHPGCAAVPQRQVHLVMACHYFVIRCLAGRAVCPRRLGWCILIKGSFETSFDQEPFQALGTRKHQTIGVNNNIAYLLLRVALLYHFSKLRCYYEPVRDSKPGQDCFCQLAGNKAHRVFCLPRAGPRNEKPRFVSKQVSSLMDQLVIYSDKTNVPQLQ